jgi:hypothetical protein
MGRPSRVMMLVVVVVAVLVAGCRGNHTAPNPAAQPGHRLEGSYTVHGIFPRRDYGAPCKGADAGYPDIHARTSVVVRDKAGALLGSTTLVGGTLGRTPLRGRDDDCQFHYSLTVPDRDAYRIQVSRRGYVEFSRADLERSGWKPGLTIGAYTMFGGD